MDKMTRVLLITGLLAVIAGVVATGVRIFIFRDYVIEYEIPCDPTAETCFIYECSEEDAAECEDWTYKIMRKKASDVHNSCGSNIIGCEAAYTCHTEDSLCEYIFCDTQVDTCAVQLPEVVVPETSSSPDEMSGIDTL